jgi:hypothetical protein
VSDTIGQLIAAGLLIGVAAIAAWLGYRAGFRAGVAALGGPARRRKHPFRVVDGDAERPREPRPPRPPESIH